jgi:hypothetical protein
LELAVKLNGSIELSTERILRDVLGEVSGIRDPERRRYDIDFQTPLWKA